MDVTGEEVLLIGSFSDLLKSVDAMCPVHEDEPKTVLDAHGDSYFTISCSSYSSKSELRAIEGMLCRDAYMEFCSYLASRWSNMSDHRVIYWRVRPRYVVKKVVDSGRPAKSRLYSCRVFMRLSCYPGRPVAQ